YREVLEHFQLSDPDLGGCRCDRVARGWRCDHEPDPHLPVLIRAVRAGDGPYLQGGELSSATGLRDHVVAGAGHSRAAPDDAGCVESVVVAVDHDVWSERRRVEAHGAIDALEDQTLYE